MAEPHFSVDMMGNVYNTSTGRLLTPSDNGNGYQYVSKYASGKTKHFYVHRLVAEVFCISDGSKSQVNHINGNKKDNRAENLEWCTSSENHLHAIRTGLKPRSTEKQKAAARCNGIKAAPLLRAGWKTWSKTESARTHFLKNLSKAHAMNKRSVVLVDSNGSITRVFDSVDAAARWAKADASTVSKVCRGKIRQTNGMVFAYKQNGEKTV